MRTATLGFVAAAMLAATPASAIHLSERGSAAYLQGTFEMGDEDAFRDFLAKPRAQKITVLHLYSPGGKIVPAVKIAHMVRRAGLATAVHATRDICDSACTLVFAGGVRRHYIDGDSVFEGQSARTGLGYHPARQLVNMVEGSQLSQGGSEVLRAHYAQMGAPRAAELMGKAAINTVFRPSGQTALRMKIATTLDAP